MTSSNEIQLKPDERVDELNRKGYRIIQDTKQFCFGMDAVLFKCFCKGKAETESVRPWNRNGSDSHPIRGEDSRRAFYRA